MYGAIAVTQTTLEINENNRKRLIESQNQNNFLSHFLLFPTI